MKKCVILSACPVAPELSYLISPDDFVIACDAGYRNCERLGCKPNIIVGDFDSAPQPEKDKGNELVVLPHVKDDTDTQYAAQLAAERGFEEVVLLGALGGKRMEHTLANLCTGLWLEQRGIQTTLYDANTRVSFVLAGQERQLSKGRYFYLSLFPMEGKATGVSIRGSFYELTDAELSSNYPLGVSNEYAENSSLVTISCKGGSLVVLETVADGTI